MKKLFVSFSLAGILLLSGCSGGHAIASAAEACNVEHSANTIVFTVHRDNRRSIVEASCILNQLKAPKAVFSRMETTRAIDGVQSATWANVQATWSYDDINGLIAIIEPAR